MTELHLAERPTTYKQVVGQRAAISQLTTMGKAGNVPHCLLFTGPSGNGKTTLARITRTKLKCANVDFVEMNCAQTRGIDMVRQIQDRVNLAPMQGPCRVWLIDECHQLTADAQGGFLKLLEEPPPHVYFMLATTNPEKLRRAIITRCTEIKVADISAADLTKLVQRVSAKHTEGQLHNDVCALLVDVAGGSARKALVLLQQIMGQTDIATAMDILQKADSQKAAIEICRALASPRTTWAKMAGILKNVEGEPEQMRWLVLSYFTTVALGGGGNTARAVTIIDHFSENFWNTKKAGLVKACFDVIET